MRTNYHTHTERCRHADNPARDYVKSAIALGLSELGFSEHAPFPDIDFGMRMPFFELTEYIEEVNGLTGEFQNDILIKNGLEIEYMAAELPYYEQLLTKFGLDYLLMGEHFYENNAGVTVNYTDAVSTEEFPIYARRIVEGMKTGYFKAVAHPDIYMADDFGWDDHCRRAADIIINGAIDTGTILEYNANGLRRGTKLYPDGERVMYPHEEFWKMAAGTEVRVLIGSDCHNPTQVWDEANEQAIRNLDILGIKPLKSIF